jgi:hypothetical protein
MELFRKGAKVIETTGKRFHRYRYPAGRQPEETRIFNNLFCAAFGFTKQGIILTQQFL